jgi:hypothetical protein
VNLIESLSNTSLTAVLAHIQQHFVDFLKLPRHKQMALAEKAITVLVRRDYDIISTKSS